MNKQNEWQRFDEHSVEFKWIYFGNGVTWDGMWLCQMTVPSSNTKKRLASLQMHLIIATVYAALSQLPVTNTISADAILYFSSVNRRYILHTANERDSETIKPQANKAVWASFSEKFINGSSESQRWQRSNFVQFFWLVEKTMDPYPPVYSDRRCTGCQMPLQTRTGYRSNCMTHTAFCLCCLFL